MFDAPNFPSPSLIPVNGVTLEVYEAGQENAGNPIVLCHGWPELAFSWRHQMAALAAAGYHVIAPNQRGFGGSSCPAAVSAYDITALTGDLTALLDHFGYADAVFAGHDWGANVVWGLALLQPKRVRGIINMALPYQPRTPTPWIDFLESLFGPDHYFVHFNRQPGVADQVLAENTPRFLRNLFRRNLPATPPEPGMMMINLALAETPQGDPLMSDDALAVYAKAYTQSGFTGGINWYRNLDRNWQILSDVEPVLPHPTLMIHGRFDMIPPLDNLTDFVPNAEVQMLDCGHWIPQECPEETTTLMLDWLARHPLG